MGHEYIEIVIIKAKNNNATNFPSELDIFYGKHMLFKVEVTNGNLIHNWPATLLNESLMMGI